MLRPPRARYLFLSLIFFLSPILTAAPTEDDRLLAVYDSHTVEEMIAKLDKLIADFPQSYRGYAFRSMMYLESQNPKLALDDCHTAIKLNPSFPYTYVICAQVTEALGDLSAARAFLLKAEEVGENYSEAPSENQAESRPKAKTVTHDRM